MLKIQGAIYLAPATRIDTTYGGPWCLGLPNALCGRYPAFLPVSQAHSCVIQSKSKVALCFHAGSPGTVCDRGFLASFPGKNQAVAGTPPNCRYQTVSLSETSLTHPAAQVFNPSSPPGIQRWPLA
eukprot:6413463-Amphidinium_carterae.1